MIYSIIYILCAIAIYFLLGFINLFFNFDDGKIPPLTAILWPILLVVAPIHWCICSEYPPKLIYYVNELPTRFWKWLLKK